MDAAVKPIAEPAAVTEFIARWKGNTGSERANFQSFMRELCELLQLPLPDPGKAENEHNAYVFERFIAPQRADSTTEKRYIDLYRRDCFVLEGKQTGKTLATQSHQNAINAAVSQAERYVRGLPLEEVEHGRPPFVVVVDVGNAIYLFAEFSRTGGNYVAYPDPRHHEIRLNDLHRPEVQDRLRRLWLDPHSLDPSKHAARVTKQVSATLAQLAKSLEQSGFEVERVANFLKRCLFTMFAEDVELLPKGSFHDLLVDIKDRNPEAFPHAVKALWETMNTGGYSERPMQTIKRFNGGLFKGIDPIPLTVDQIQLLVDAAKADWRFVEPAIFGTLLERALDPRERHKLGAHYTPRAYVERLVMPTLIEPLREQWGDVRAAAETLLRQGKPDKALQEVQAFHYRLCQTRVLDPACGSANFLYVALEHMKRLEGEVLGFIAEQSQGQGRLETEGLTVDPHQFLGLEINPRAAAIAELVLWIGYLQWHYRLSDRLDLPEPILRDFKNIECRDALIEYDSREPELDENDEPVTIWDGITVKVSPTTGDLIPDETGRATVYRYHNPRCAVWPKADYILGNPPFISKRKIRTSLGDGYTDAIRSAYKDKIPDGSDLVMYWWSIAAEKVSKGDVERSGLITTNSIWQPFNRRVLREFISDNKSPVSIVYATPDHPWTTGDGSASVRIAMTVFEKGERPGVLAQVVAEHQDGGEGKRVELKEKKGLIYSNLTVGADTASAIKLDASSGIASKGVIPSPVSGFSVSREEAAFLEGDDFEEKSSIIKPYRNGKDISQKSRGLYIIDVCGMTENELMSGHPKVFQWIKDRVKPKRDQDKNKKRKELWWVFADPAKSLRNHISGLSRYIVTLETSKHRFFDFIDGDVLPDHMLVSIGSDRAFHLGVLSSRLHVAWALSTGSRQGIGNDPRYIHSRSLETFPFPDCSRLMVDGISDAAEELLRHRHVCKSSGVTMTDAYNVLDKTRTGEHLSEKERSIYQKGAISVLGKLHDNLDRVVFEAYGWEDLADRLVGCPGATTPMPSKSVDQGEAEEELLMRMVELNKQRAAEEAQGNVRWLRPEYQAPEVTQVGAELPTEQAEAPKAAAATTKGKAIFPKAVPEQLKVLREALAERPHTAESLAELFKHKPRKSVKEGLLSLVAVGRAEHDQETDTWYSNV